MKKDIHPDNYREVIFRDQSAGFSFLTRSTAKSNENIKWEDGNEYPVIDIYISSASHPFYTGKEKLIDTEGRVDKFEARRKAATEKKKALSNKASKKLKEDKEKATEKQQRVAEKPAEPKNNPKSDS